MLQLRVPETISHAAVAAARQTATYWTDRSQGQPSERPPQIGHYEILGELARGGMGVVYRARQLGADRLVALKMIKPGMGLDTEAIERFRLEAEAAAQLDHPGIVPIYEVGEWQGNPYFSMAFVEGVNLAQTIRDAAWEGQQAAILMKMVAAAISYAHRRGVVHRDLKPANILLGRDGQPRVTDFGLAKRLEGNQDLTITGQAMGTPSYMAPEQAAGIPQGVGPHTDIYGLGATLYCLLVGRPPFQAASTWATLQQVLHDDPVPPRRFNAAISPDLETICLKCLEKNPQRRYSSAEELAQDLDRYTAGYPISARPLSRVERIARWCRRNPLLATSFTTTMLAILLGVAGIAWQLRETIQARDRYSEANERLTQSERDQRSASLAAQASEREAQVSAREANLQRYAVSINLAYRAFEEGRVEEARNLLRELLPASGTDDLREFSWYRLWGLIFHESGRWNDGGARVAAIALAPQDQLLAFGGDLGLVSLVDWRTSEKVSRELADSAAIGAVTALSFSPSGKLLAVGREDGQVRLWNVDSWERGKLLVATDVQIRDLAFHPTGEFLAVASAGVDRPGEVTVWNLKNEQILLRLKQDRRGNPGHPHGPSGLCFSGTGNLLAVSSFDGRTRLWSFPSGELKQETLIKPPAWVNDVALTHDDQTLYTTRADGSLRVWNVPQWTSVEAPRFPAEQLVKAALSGDSQRLFVGGTRGAAMLDIPTQRWRSIADEVEVISVALTRDGKTAFTGSASGGAKAWSFADSAQGVTRRTDPTTGLVTAISFSRDSNRLALAGFKGFVGIYDYPSLQLVSSQNTPALRGKISSVAMSFDGAYYIWNEVVFRCQDGVKLNLPDDCRSLAFAPHKSQVLAWQPKSGIVLFDLATGNPIRTFPWSNRPLRCLRFTPDGESFLVLADDVMQRYDVASGEVRLRIDGRANRMGGVTIARDAELLGFQTQGQISIWNWKTGASLGALTDPNLRYAEQQDLLAFSPDGRTLASLSQPYAALIKLYDVASQRLLTTFRWDTDHLVAIAFTADGRQLVAAGGEMTNPYSVGRLTVYQTPGPQQVRAEITEASRVDWLGKRLRQVEIAVAKIHASLPDRLAEVGASLGATRAEQEQLYQARQATDELLQLLQISVSDPQIESWRKLAFLRQVSGRIASLQRYRNQNYYYLCRRQLLAGSQQLAQDFPTSTAYLEQVIAQRILLGMLLVGEELPGDSLQKEALEHGQEARSLSLQLFKNSGKDLAYTTVIYEALRYRGLTLQKWGTDEQLREFAENVGRQNINPWRDSFEAATLLASASSDSATQPGDWLKAAIELADTTAVLDWIERQLLTNIAWQKQRARPVFVAAQELLQQRREQLTEKR
ncbi:MAG: protein kinase domain-containing protein [Planctomycetota bacterium]